MQTKEIENEIRKQRGLQIAQTCQIIKRQSGDYVVPSQSGNGAYIVGKAEAGNLACDCPDYEHVFAMGVKCKHIWAVEVKTNRKLRLDGSTEITKTIKVSYPQNWSAYDYAKTHEKELFQKLLYDLCQSIENPEYKFGRPTLPLSDMVFSSALKVYTTFSLRRFMSDMQIAKEKGYIDKVPYYTSVARYMENPELTPLLLKLIISSATPLKSIETDFAVDSSGFSTCRFDRWFSFKYGREVNSKIWLKAHVISGVKTNIVAGVKITKSFSHDTKEFPDLVTETAKTFTIKEVSADKAYLSRKNIKLVDKLGARSYIPFKENTSGKAKGSLLWTKMYFFFMCNRAEFLQHYHKRSNVETTFHMIKSKFGDSLRSKTKTAQINEALLKILCHNICVVIQEMQELGIEANFAKGLS